MMFVLDREFAVARAPEKQHLYADAEAVYQKILGLFPKNARALQEGNKLSIRQIITDPLASESTNYHFNCFGKLYRDKKFAEIMKERTNILPEFPTFNSLFHIVSAAYQWLQKFDTAIRCFMRALKRNPSLVNVVIRLGSTYCESGETRRAIEYFEKALRLKPNNPITHFNPEDASTVLGNSVAAEKSYRAAIQINPRLAQAHVKPANLFSSQGDPDGAGNVYEKALEIVPSSGYHYRDYSNAKTFKPDDPLITRMRTFIHTENFSPNSEIELKITLAKSKRDIGNISSSFDFLNAARAVGKQSFAYHIEQDQRVFARIKDYFSVLEKIFMKLDYPAQSQQPIFIRDVPRSGTTLVEHILASHAKVYGSVELEFIVRIFEKSEHQYAEIKGSIEFIRLSCKDTGLAFVTRNRAVWKASIAPVKQKWSQGRSKEWPKYAELLKPMRHALT